MRTQRVFPVKGDGNATTVVLVSPPAGFDARMNGCDEQLSNETVGEPIDCPV